MRLLNIHDLAFRWFHPNQTPKYAIASHRWAEGAEASIKDVSEKRNTDSIGYRKITGFAEFIKENVTDIEWMWIDTCCINQESSQEVSEAINSMFKWYRNAEVCLAYLADIKGNENVQGLRYSEWFSRGWTLQELLAPRAVVFLTQEWEIIGHKGCIGDGTDGIPLPAGPSLGTTIAAITGIPESVLGDYKCSQGLSVEERLQWMVGRETTREEDMTYSLLGIFDVSMPAIYGEGKEKARKRLLAEIFEDGIGLGKRPASYGEGEERVGKRLRGEMPPEKAAKEEFEREKKNFIKSLSFPEIESRYHAIEEALSHTCQWLIHHPLYTKWRTANRRTIPDDALWVKGKPGAGKSTLMKTAYKGARMVDHGVLGADHGTVTVGFFFNARGARLERCPEGFFRSILHQLFVRSEQVNSEFVQVYSRKHGSLASGWTWSEAELREMLKTTIVTFKSFRILMYVDALDECEEKCIRKLVDFLKEALQLTVHAGSDLRICVSSRHCPNIRMPQDSTISVEHYNTADISAYVCATLTNMGRYTVDLHHSITDKAAGIFLWPVLVLQKLREAVEDGEPQQTISSILASIPEDLDELFRGLVATIASADRPKATSLMLWVLFAKRPLSVAELRLALAFDTRYSTQKQYEESEAFVKSDDDAEKLLRKWSRGLIEVRATKYAKPIVQFVHESVREFLLAQNGFDIFEAQLSEQAVGIGNCRLARACFNYLDIDDLVPFKGFGLYPTSLSQANQCHPFLEYASTFAFDHAADAERQAALPIELVRQLTERWELSPRRWLPYYVDHQHGYGKIDAMPNIMHLVCESGILSWLRYLISRGDDVNAVSGFYGSALCAATSAGHHEIVKDLLEHKADVGAHSRRHGTPLAIAAEQNSMKICEMLLEAGANVNARGSSDNTPLESASENGNESLVRQLLAKGALVARHSGNLYEATNALEKAAQHKHNHILALLLDDADKTCLPLDHYLIALSRCKCSMACSEREHMMLRSAVENIRNKRPESLLAHVYVKTLSVKTIEIVVWLNDTCLELKNKIHKMEGLDPSQQYLVFNDRWIPERAILKDKGLYNYCTVHLLLPIWKFRYDYR